MRFFLYLYLNEEKVTIIDYTNDLKEHIKILNYEWLENYFHIKKGDER